MATASFKLTIKDLPEIQKALRSVPEKSVPIYNNALRKTALAWQRQARINAPVRTALLRNRIETAFGNLKAEVIANTPYAIFVHEGTRPHVILPRVKKALYWKDAPHPVFSVQHPGTQANPFMLSALRQTEGQVGGFFKQAAVELAKAMVGQ